MFETPLTWIERSKLNSLADFLITEADGNRTTREAIIQQKLSTNYLDSGPRSSAGLIIGDQKAADPKSILQSLRISSEPACGDAMLPQVFLYVKRVKLND